MSKLKIAFVGTGMMGQVAHLTNYIQLVDHCEVVAVVEPGENLRKAVTTRFNIPGSYPTLDQMLESEEVDAIVAAQNYRRHIMVLPQILEARIPLFSEKPVALSVKNGEILVKLAEKHNTLHMVGYHKRSDPAMEYAKKVVDEWKQSGAFGKMRYIRVTMPPGDWINGVDSAIAMKDRILNGEFESMPEEFDEKNAHLYDQFVNYYIHQVNAIRFLGGEPYRFVYGDRSGVLFTGESVSGVTSVIEMAPYRTTIEWKETILVAFEKGFVEISLPAPLARQRAGTVRVMRDSGAGMPEYTEPVLPNLTAMRKQAMNFLAAVKGERPAPCISKEALRDLIIARDYVQFMQNEY